MFDRVPQARIYRLYHAPAWRDADMPRLQLFASVLSGSRSARLDRRLVYDQELATSVTASTEAVGAGEPVPDHGDGEGRRRSGARGARDGRRGRPSS